MRIAAALIFFLLAKTSQAQTSSYLTDLSTLRSLLEKTPSFKVQIKGDKLTAYNALYNRLAADTINIKKIEETYAQG